MKIFISQKWILASSFFVSAFAGVLLVPLIARLTPADFLASVAILYMLGALFGGLDVLKPVFVRELSTRYSIGEQVKIKNHFNFAIYWGGVTALLVFCILYLFFLDRLGFTAIWIIASSSFIYNINMLFYSVLDSKGKTGLSQLYKAGSTALLYLGFCFLAILGVYDITIFALVFPVGQLAAAIFGFWSSKSYLLYQRGCEDLSGTQFKETFFFNLYRAAVDFSDRLILSNFLSSQLYSSYSLAYEAVSRSNIPVQYYCVYNYPKLCRENPSEGRRLRGYLNISLFVFVMFALGALLLLPFNDDILSIYLGAGYSQYGFVVSFLLLCAALQSFNILYQDVLRMEGKYILLRRLFGSQVLIFLVILYPLYFYFDIEGLLGAVLILKAASVPACCYYMTRSIFKIDPYLLLFLVSLFVSIIFFVIFGGVFLGFSVFAALFISLCVQYFFLFDR
ncbi:hypothetical protein [Stutzerimonas nitrititolerans]|uniref:hypothetical protein n=1 Tax=Stutzerimonas nitrititolerans TaxID=2482751 RepID=UPI0028A78CE9|nr:hypothetical protein [Stutzerimonas nitrititolerans]